MSEASTQLRSFQSPVTALVQGASRGIGLAFVRQLLSDPAVGRVFATCRSPEESEGLRTMEASDAERLRPVTMDLTIEASVESAAAEVARATRKVDLLINCAGVLHGADGMHPERRLADIDPRHLLRSYQVNAIGPLLVAKHFQQLLASQDRVVFASLSARVGSIGDNRLGGWYAYRAAKAAQNMMTRNLSIELRRTAKQIICVALHPGTVNTDLSRPFQSSVPADRLFAPDLAVRQLLSVIDSLTPRSNGHFYGWDGKEIPW